MGLLDEFINGDASPAPVNAAKDLAPLTDAHGEVARGAPAPPAEQAPVAATSEPSDPFTAILSKASPTAAPEGSSPDSAIQEPALTIMQNGHLGWVRGPQQEAYLRSMFDDVKLMPTPEGGAGWVVKNKDGKWQQADPNMHWTTALAGNDAPAWDIHNAKVVGGRAAKWAGEYLPRAIAAVEAGMAAVPAGVAAGTPGGPIGMAAGGAIAGISAAGLASAGVEAVDLASRQLLPKNEPGRTPYSNPQEVSQQLFASALFGMDSLAEGKATEGVALGSAKGLGKILSGLAGSPEGRVTAAKLMGGMGANPGLVEARMMNPARTAGYDIMAADDANIPMGDPTKFAGKLNVAEDAAWSSDAAETPGLLEEMQGALKREQGAYARLQANPKVQALEADNAQIAQDPLNYLKQKQIVTANGRMVPKEQGGVYGEGDEGAITYLRALANKPDTNKMTYQQIRQEVSKIGVLLNGKIQNNELRMLLTQTKNKLNGSAINGLGEDLGGQYKAIQAQYGPVRDTLESLANVTDKVQKKAAFVNSLVNTEKRNVNKSLVAGIQQAGVPFDNIEKLLQIQAAREAAPLFTNKGRLSKWSPFGLPNGNKVAAGLVNGHNAVSQLAKGIASSDPVQKTLPYTAKALSFMRNLPPDQLKTFLTRPELFDAVAGTAAAGSQNQQQEMEQLLQQAGVK